MSAEQSERNEAEQSRQVANACDENVILHNFHKCKSTKLDTTWSE